MFGPLALTTLLAVGTVAHTDSGCCGDDVRRPDTVYHELLIGSERLRAVWKQQPHNHKALQRYVLSQRRLLSELLEITGVTAARKRAEEEASGDEGGEGGAGTGADRESAGDPGGAGRGSDQEETERIERGSQEGPAGSGQPGQRPPTEEEIRARERAIENFLNAQPWRKEQFEELSVEIVPLARLDPRLRIVELHQKTLESLFAVGDPDAEPPVDPDPAPNPDPRAVAAALYDFHQALLHVSSANGEDDDEG